MNTTEVVELARQTIMLVITISAPILIVAAVTGVSISLAQVITSMQDMTLSTVLRLLAVAATGLATLPWMLRHLAQFTADLFANLQRYAH